MVYILSAYYSFFFLFLFLSDCASSIDNELHDTSSILEKYYSSLRLGPVLICIDGLNDLDDGSGGGGGGHVLTMSQLIPSKLEPDCKFVLTVQNSSECYVELASRRQCAVHEFELLRRGADDDYKSLFRRLLNATADGSADNPNRNVLYAKCMDAFRELKAAHHFANAFFIVMMAQEIFNFDKEIYKTHPVHLEYALNNLVQTSGLDPNLTDGHQIVESVTSALNNTANANANNTSSNDNNNNNNNTSGSNEYSSSLSKSGGGGAGAGKSATSFSVNIINSYIEEVSTLKGIMEKIIKRYIKKNINWSRDTTVPLSFGENAGWLGDVLCLIAVSTNGIRKDALFRILNLRGFNDVCAPLFFVCLLVQNSILYRFIYLDK